MGQHLSCSIPSSLASRFGELFTYRQGRCLRVHAESLDADNHELVGIDHDKEAGRTLVQY